MGTPRAGRPTRRRHLEVLVLSVAALAAAPLLEVRTGGKVGARGIPAIELPPTCGAREFLNIDCPGCGLTRSFVHLSRGDLDSSLQCHRIGWLFMAVLAFQIPYRILALRRPGRLQLGEVITHLSGPILIALLIANWFLLLAGR